VRNSSLVECSRAEDVTGLNILPKLWDLINSDFDPEDKIGRRALYGRRSDNVS
jgi:hypothetical protein